MARGLSAGWTAITITSTSRRDLICDLRRLITEQASRHLSLVTCHLIILKCGGAAWLRGQSSIYIECWRPLEPDAGNAAAGRSEPDWHLSHAFVAHGLFIFNRGLHG